MFGYVKPRLCELSDSERELYNACYCGLCHALGKNHGFKSRFILRYEFVFLVMLFWQPGVELKIKKKRCIASPVKKKSLCIQSSALDICADLSIMFFIHKLKDDVVDKSFFQSIPYRLLLWMFRRSYKKAACANPALADIMDSNLLSLYALEKDSERSMDIVAEKFADILCAAVPSKVPQDTMRPLKELLYHLGRWIYIIDACDDYSSDLKSKTYNAVAARFSSKGEKPTTLPHEHISRLQITLKHSNNLLCSAFELLPESIWSSTIRNTIYLSMPDVCYNVFERNNASANE